MPVERRAAGARKHPKHDEMVAELARHLHGGAGLPSEPRIVEEVQRLSDALHVFVFWSEWETVTEEERASIILDAYEQERSKEEALKITVAMGLTPMEAKRLGMEA
jgi:hypothetical protein